MKVNVGIGEMAIAVQPEAIISTLGVGSCLVLCAFDPVAKIGGMLHAKHPLGGRGELAHAECSYVDRGTHRLLERLFELGATSKDLQIKLAGCASMSGCDSLKVGKRNHTVARRILWKNSLLIAAEDCGGEVARNVTLFLANGRVDIQTAGRIITI